MRRGARASQWKGKGVRVDEVVAELARLNRALQDHGHGHGMARVLNLIWRPPRRNKRRQSTTPSPGWAPTAPHERSPYAGTTPIRLDAELVLECGCPTQRAVWRCHDRVILTADDSRLEHAASLLAPLLLSDLPAVLWLPEPNAPIPDRRLLDRVQQILVDSTTGDGAALPRLGKLTRNARVHDLTWGRLEFWRAATAAAFDPPRAAGPAVPDGASRGLLRRRRSVRGTPACRLGGGPRGLATGDPGA